jgi:clan AA aspartic protease (TIGR02281 family)
MGFSLRRKTSLQRRSLATGIAMIVLFAAHFGAAEIYKWKDQSGRLHFSQDLNRVPARYRSQAKGDAIEEGTGSVIQRYEPAPAATRPGRPKTNAARTAGSSDVYKIRVQKTGSSMRVNVRLNDRVTAPFYIDTGASDVSLPEWVAKELGLDLASARTDFYSTANGTVQSALVTLESVELGGARVENVPAHVSKTMSVGLLGLSFFNHFRYRVDPASGIVTLRPNGLAESGLIRGGRSEGQWKGEFARLERRRTAIEVALDESNPNRARRKLELKDAIEEVERQLKVLDREADDARVPMRWRN